MEEYSLHACAETVFLFTFFVISLVFIFFLLDWCVVEACGLGSYNFSSFEPASETQLLTMSRVSPIQHVKSVITPTLICLGAKDKRVPPSQGWEFYHVLKAQGVDTR